MASDDAGEIERAGKLLAKMKASFIKEHKTNDLKYREGQLRSLLKGMQALRKDMEEAKAEDLGTNDFTAYLMEGFGAEGNLKHTIKHFKGWAKDQEVPTPNVVGPGRSYVRNEPLGITLIIGAWNFPYVTIIGPLVANIAAGNGAIIKPSEMTPACASVVCRLIRDYLDPELFEVVEGGPEIAKFLTASKFDAIIYTGSPQKGRLVAAAAAANLVPCILELGGKSPCIVDETADLECAALKLAFGRFINSGQICIAPDYVLVSEKVKDKFTPLLTYKARSCWVEAVESHTKGPTDMSHMVNEFHTKRVLGLINGNHGGKILLGGKGSVEERWVDPTIIESPDPSSPLMQEEIFGPVLPVIYYKEISEAIDFINGRDKPLALYYFGKSIKNPNKDRVVRETSSGALAVNEVLFQCANDNLPFGGVGNAGYGKYHGPSGFMALTNAKAVLSKPALKKFPYSNLFPPYTNSKKGMVRRMLTLAKGDQGATLDFIWLLLVVALFFALYSYGPALLPPIALLVSVFVLIALFFSLLLNMIF